MQLKSPAAFEACLANRHLLRHFSSTEGFIGLASLRCIIPIWLAKRSCLVNAVAPRKRAMPMDAFSTVLEPKKNKSSHYSELLAPDSVAYHGHASVSRFFSTFSRGWLAGTYTTVPFPCSNSRVLTWFLPDHVELGNLYLNFERPESAP